MFGKIVAFVMILMLASPLVSGQTSKVCGACMPNFALCVNETSYRLCYEVTTLSPIDEEIYTCKENEYCTDSENICEVSPDGVDIKVVCNGQQSSAACSSCAGKTNGQFICVSATQFAICRGDPTAEPSNPLSCPTDQLCSEELITEYNLKKACAPQAVLDYFDVKVTCPNEDLVAPPTTKAPPVSATTPMETDSFCKASTQTGFYFQIPHPSDCQAYIYCERNGNSFISMVMRCKTGQFYSEEMKRCIKALQCPQ